MMRRDGCVGQLQVQSAQAGVPLGFICGSLPVPTVNPASNPLSPTQAALVPAINLLSQRTGAPRYRLLPTETDLNTAPSHGVPWDELLPVTSSSHDANGLCNTWEQGGYLMQPLARKCETLAVSALTGYGDEIDVVAPVDILKQIFKTPYSKSRLSVAVHRVGHTLILNSGPDMEEGEKIARRKKSQAKAMEKSLFSKFVQHSVHEGPPDLPKGTHCDGDGERVSPKRVVSRRNGCDGGLDFSQQGGKFMREQQQKKRDNNFMPKDPDEPPRQSASESFLRVLFWQFQNLRMLLGSDLLLFSNEKHAAVSLHLMEIGRQVTPLMWLDAWLDNVMASIPELAVCYHRNGVVQGYELLKTDDIFLLKGLSEDGTAFFSPHVVQQNASSVLRFLQENCKQDPGTYWLFKNAGEDLMQLFDLSVISKTRNTCGDKEDEECGTLPSSRNRGNGHYSLPLAMLLYRLANRLSRSQDPADRLKCAKLFGKCLEYMDEQEHLVIRASAHEHAARLILACYKQLGVMLQPLLLEDNNNAATTPVKLDVKKPALELPSIETNAGLQEELIHKLSMEDHTDCHETTPANAISTTTNVENPDGYANLLTTPPTDLVLATNTSIVETVAVADPVPHVVQALADPVSARLAAVHHLSQAIKSLRWQRQLQDVGERRVVVPPNEHNPKRTSSHSHYHTECVCGEPECVAICDFRDIQVGFGMDEKLWQLLLLLGESYLTLGRAYEGDGQYGRALKAVELACLVRGSTPQPSEEQGGFEATNNKVRGLFWGQVWVLVGDVFAEIQRSLDAAVVQHQDVVVSPGEEDLKMAQEVMKEVKRLKKKVGQFQGNCEICSLTSCSCQSDRASSGISASSSSGGSSRSTSFFPSEGNAGKYARKQHVKKNNNNCKTTTTPDVVAVQERNKLVNETSSSAMTSVAKCMRGEALMEEGKPTERMDIFTYLGRPVANDWESNLSAASKCYSAAVDAFADSVHLRDYESVLRKKGWACNELGRRRLAHGNAKAAEAAFETAIAAFRTVKDLPNMVLVYCNLAHGQRAAAEVFAAQLTTWEGCQLSHFYYAFVKTVGKARFLYQEALEFYGEARKELLAWGDNSTATMRGLCNEVYTQLAHTYLKLGMLLAREDKFLNANRSSGSHELDYYYEGRKAGLISAKEAISKALVLYESLGALRAQEAAYAQFQLGCQQRDSCLFAIAGAQGEEAKQDSRLQGARRLAAMADRYWQKALGYYRADTHPDMVLQILMERSTLCLAVAPASHANAVLEQALVHLLEGCRAAEFRNDDDENACHISPNIFAAFALQLQRLLKTMLGAALSRSRSKSCDNNNNNNGVGRSDMNGGSLSKANDVDTLKKMYGSALKLMGGNDLRGLYSMWYNS